MMKRFIALFGVLVLISGLFYGLALAVQGIGQPSSTATDISGFSYCRSNNADVTCKATAGFIHTITCSSDAAATAGTIAILDHTTVGGGTTILTLTYAAANYPPSTLTLDVHTATGIVLDYTTTNDVDCMVSYR